MDVAPAVVSLAVADEPEAWTAAGFTVTGRTCRVGGVRIDLVGSDAGHGVVGWALRDLPDGAPPDLDGFATTADDPAPSDDEAPGAGPDGAVEHANTATSVDHIVLLTDDIDRTVAAAAPLGLLPRRWRDHSLPDGTPVRQAFLRAGEVVLEVVAPAEQPPDPRPGVRSFGVAVTVADIDLAASRLGEAIGSVRGAVQHGRRIATVRGRAIGLGTPVALMSPRPDR